MSDTTPVRRGNTMNATSEVSRTYLSETSSNPAATLLGESNSAGLTDLASAVIGDYYSVGDQPTFDIQSLVDPLTDAIVDELTRLTPSWMTVTADSIIEVTADLQRLHRLSEDELEVIRETASSRIDALMEAVEAEHLAKHERGECACINPDNE